MNFHDRMLPTSKEYAFYEDGYYVWCGTMFKYKDSYYLLYSRWEQKEGFEAWVTHSEICLAKADTMLGKFRHLKVLFDNNAKNGKKTVYHNPTVIDYKGKYYIYG